MTSGEYADIPVDAIDRPKHPLREVFDDDYIGELMYSMSQHGLIHPVRVKSSGTRYEVITGDCRVEAARRLSWPQIKCIFTDQTEGALREMQLHENIHRLDLKPSREAAYVKILYEDEHFAVTRIATICGRSIPWVEERLEMTEWPEGLIDYVDAKKISLGVARILNRIPDDTTLKYLANQAAEQGATIRQALAWYHSYMAKPWALPTAEEIEEAKKRLEPPPVPMAMCGGCDIQLTITQLATWLLCPTCQMRLPQLKREI